jgi:hypothetical protein
VLKRLSRSRLEFADGVPEANFSRFGVRIDSVRRTPPAFYRAKTAQIRTHEWLPTKEIQLTALPDVPQIFVASAATSQSSLNEYATARRLHRQVCKTCMR